MTAHLRIAAIIPARLASTRFPNKPLVEVEGLPMIEHVRRRALLCQGFDEVIVATCDADIANVVKKFGGRVVMTSNTHRVATERLVEAMASLNCTHVVNVQGDEMLVLPSDLDRMVAAIHRNPQASIWNAVAPVEDAAELKDASWVKCVLTQNGQVFFCGRDMSYAKTADDGWEPIYKVIGILAYARPFLENFANLSPTPLEKRESVEQLRFLEHGYSIEAVRFEKGYVGVNVPQEMDIVRKAFREDRRQREILKKNLEL